jgi:hypothetical protein
MTLGNQSFPTLHLASHQERGSTHGKASVPHNKEKVQEQNLPKRRVHPKLSQRPTRTLKIPPKPPSQNNGKERRKNHIHHAKRKHRPITNVPAETAPRNSTLDCQFPFYTVEMCLQKILYRRNHPVKTPQKTPASVKLFHQNRNFV